MPGFDNIEVIVQHEQTDYKFPVWCLTNNNSSFRNCSYMKCQYMPEPEF